MNIKGLDNTTMIDIFKLKDEKKISSLYKELYPKLSNWLRKTYQINCEEDCKEIVSRSFTILYYNGKKGKIDDLQSSVETYLFGVAKLVVLEWRREQKSKETVESKLEFELENLEQFNRVFSFEGENDSMQEKLYTAFSKLGEPCQTVLKLFYWEQNSMEAIAIKTGYKNENVAKKKKHNCIKKLKSYIEKT